LEKATKIQKLDMQENESFRSFSKRLSEETKKAIHQINTGISKAKPMRPSRKRCVFLFYILYLNFIFYF